MNVGSLFSGIGGFDYGLERAGFAVAWQCEADPFCRRVLARHWPEVPCYDDVRELRAIDVEPVDVLCGGFPCQDISLAGKGAGIGGARSGLWGEYARLIRELRPRYVIVENVAALLARGLDVVLADLAACGYDAEWDCVPASAVGAPHRRDRLWLVAYPGGEQHEGASHEDGWTASERLPEAATGTVPDAHAGGRQERSERDSDPAQPGLEASQRHDADGFRSDVADTELAGLEGHRGRPLRPGAAAGGSAGARDVADAEGEPVGAGLRTDELGGLGRGRSGDSGGEAVQDADECALLAWRVGGRTAQAGGPEWWAVEPPVGRVAHGVPDRLDQLAALGNALVPQIAEWLGGRILEWESSVTL